METRPFGQAAPEAVINAAPCGIHALDRDGKYVAVNDTELRWLGYAREELLGMPAAEVLSLDSLPEFKERFQALARRGSFEELEAQLVRRDGTRFPALVSLSALRDARGRLVECVCAVYDLTERRRHEQERTTRAREASQREFVANVSHEFRTPLAAILGFAETLREGALDNPRVGGRFLATIERHAHRLLGLVDSVLDVSERDSGGRRPAREPVDLRELTRKIARGLAPLARASHVALSVHVAASMAVDADPAQLEQVLSNLIGNAIKYNKRGGRVVVGARRVPGRQIQVTVRDTGIGIADDELPYLFERFHRSKDPKARERKGSGLGLAITDGIVRAHGGRLWADSRLGEGSAFHFTLPSA